MSQSSTSTASAFLLPTLLALFVSSCSCGDPPPSAAAGRLPLDTILGPGEVRCGAVEKPSELIGGPGAYGQVGHAFRCHNALLRFIVQDAERPVGNSAEGGSLVDVDRVGVDEAVDGDDTFRELVPLMGANEVAVETIEIVNDGSDGKAGIIRVTGRPTAITLAPQAEFLARDMVGVVTTDYVLEPDSDVIRITTTFVNEGDDALFGLLGADFVAFGGATPPTSPERGFGDVPLFSQISFLAGARGKASNIAYVCDGRDVTIPLVESGATVAVCADDLNINAEGSFTRFVVVGDGSVESVAARAWQLRGEATGTVSGTVDGAIENAIDGTLVTALSGSLADVDGDVHAVNEARVVDGAFSLTLPPGDYVLVAHVPGATGQVVGRSAEVGVSVVAGEARTTALALGASGRIDVVTTFNDPFAGDPSGQTRAHPAKLTLVPLGDTQRPADVLHDHERQGAARYVVSVDGVFSVDVPPGRWRALVSRGFEWSRHDEDIDVAAGATVEVDAALVRALDTDGWLAGEFHQHTLGSIDSVVPVPLKVMENAVEGIEIAVSTDHDNIVDFQPFVAELGLQDDLMAFAGEEVSYQAVGHFNAYPFAIDPADPFRDIGSRMWWQKTLPQMYADIRAAAGPLDDGDGDDDASDASDAKGAIIQLNHPRSGGSGMTASMNFDPSDAARIPQDPPDLAALPPDIFTAWSPDFDAIEVNTNLGDVGLYTADRAALAALADDSPTSVPVLADWFALMGAGLPIAAMGNSDTHGLNEGVGYPRTYLFTGARDAGGENGDDPTTMTRSALAATIRAQRTAIAEGCLLTLDVDGTPRMGHGDLVSLADAAGLTAHLQAPPHVTVGRLELYVNGVAQTLARSAVDPDGVVDVLPTGDVDGTLSLPLAGLTADGASRLRHTFAGLDLAEDSVVVVVSRGGSGLDPTGGGQVVCVSPPVYVDVDGDDAFSPWLAATEEVTRPVP